MSLESILKHILGEAEKKKEGILLSAQKEREGILQQAQQEAEKLYQEILREEKALSEGQRRHYIVSARLERKKELLSLKQELIGSVFAAIRPHLKGDKFKKQQILTDKVREEPEDIEFYLNKIRKDYETALADILFKG